MIGILKKIRSAITFLFLFAVLLAFNRPFVVVCVLISVLIHEGGHALALLCFHKRVHGIDLCTSGAKMRYEGRLSYKSELVVLACGPLCNLIVGAISFLLWSFSSYPVIFGATNLFYALTNLLPLPSYDGERILNILFSMRYGSGVCERWLGGIGFFLRCVLLFFSLYLIFYFDIAYQVFFCIFLSFIPDLKKREIVDKV
ncbi:MAG: hypothetical protein IKC72_05665 [Clostridia bacterium]|nr:hypothetical protein [Clostridia bacterium]